MYILLIPQRPAKRSELAPSLRPRTGDHLTELEKKVDALEEVIEQEVRLALLISRTFVNE